MSKLFVSALLCVLGTSMLLYLIQPVDAAEPGRVFVPPLDQPAMPPVVAWPEPKAPFENTLITPFETVGAAQFEPF